MKIFLGGTCPQNEKDFDYRKILMPFLSKQKIDYFNPVVDDWTEDCIIIEENEKEICDVHFYLIAPNMKGVYSIAESFASLLLYGEKRSILIVQKSCNDKNFDDGQLKSLEATLDLFSKCGGEPWYCDSQDDLNDDFVKKVLLEIKQTYYPFDN